MKVRLILITALVVLGICSFFWMRTRPAAGPTAKPVASESPSAAVDPGSLPSQQQLAADIIRQGVTPERAKLYFSMVVGKLPGVTVPAGKRDAGDFDGTLAISYLYRVWDTLTPEQKATAGRLVGGPEHVHAAGDAMPSVISHGTLAVAASYVFLLADNPAFDYTTMAKNADGTLAALLNVPGVSFDLAVEYGAPPEKDGASEYAHTWSWTWGNVLGWDKGCHITLWNQKFLGLNEDDANAVVTHEMFHCFQQRTAQTAMAWGTIGAWIAEGEATWAMSTVVYSNGNTNIYAGKWNLYVFGPLTRYADRAYDALGVYGHMSDLAGADAVWSRLLPMVVAGTNHDDTGAFNLLIQGSELQYYTSWGASYFLVAGNTPWTMQSPGTPPSFGPSPASISVESGTEEALTPVGPNQSALFQLDGGADIVAVALLTGYGRLHDQGFAVDTALDTSGPLILCLKQGGCTCPDGSPGASQFTRGAIAPLSIGINGGDTTAQVGVAGKSLDSFCKKPEQKPPLAPPSGGGGGGGGGGGDGDNTQPPPPSQGTSKGDTHLATFDGLYYDFQVVGEYTLAKSAKDDFTVQVRQVPVPGKNFASVNQAMATTMGGERVTVTMEKGAAVLRIDGKAINGPLPKLKGGTLTGATTAFGSSYQFTWPDGTQVRAEQLGSYALNVRVLPSAARKGSFVGLLGDDDGVQANDLVGAHQFTLGINPKPDDINHALADAWRVSPNTSLFDYQAGQTSATFGNPEFPYKDTESNVTNRAEAEKLCREEGVTDPHLLDNCILDLAVTRSFVFGSQYAHAQQVLAARGNLEPPRSPAVLNTLVMTGEILDNVSKVVFQFQANKDDVIWIWDPDCTDKLGQFHPVFLLLFDPSGKQVGDAAPGCAFGRRDLPATGTYSVRANFGYRNEITRWRIPIRFIRHTRRQNIFYGAMVSGNIEHKAAQDIYSWQGQAGDDILISGPGCDLGGLVTDLIEPNGHQMLGPGCRTGTDYRLPMSGTYQLLVNSMHSGPGAYHFVFQGGKPNMK